MVKKLYERDSYLKEFDAKVVSCVKEDDKYLIELDQTAFFPEEGGQLGDVGTLNDKNVVDVQIKNDRIFHITEEPFEVGEAVHGVLDWETRFSRMQNHSGEHIVSGIIFAEFGFNNVGFHLGHDIVTLDLDGVLKPEDVVFVEREANRRVFQNNKVNVLFPSEDELDNYNFRSKIGSRQGIRLVDIENCDLCACCAPHVKSTGEIGMIKIISSASYKGGTRLSILCGKMAYDYFCEIHEIVEKERKLFSATKDNVLDKIKELQNNSILLQKEIENLKNEIAISNVKFLSGNNYKVAFTDNCEFDTMRACLNANMTENDVIYIIVSFFEDRGLYMVGSKNIPSKDITALINGNLGGKGGGRDNFSQGKFSESKENAVKFFDKLLNG